MFNKTTRKLIRIESFLKQYCSGISNVKHKLRGKDGNNKPIDFSETEKSEITQGLQKFAKDILK